MRYKGQVIEKVDVVKNTAELIKRGLVNRTLTPEDIITKLEYIINILADVDNLVQKENESMS